MAWAFKKLLAEHSPGVSDRIFNRIFDPPSDALEIYQDSGKAVANKSTKKNKNQDLRTNFAVNYYTGCHVGRILSLDRYAGSNVRDRGVSSMDRCA